MEIIMVHAWVTMCFIFISFPHTHTAASQVDVLIALKNGLTDPSNNLQEWNLGSINPCLWSHVTCNTDNSVTNLELQSLNLSGELSPDIGQLGSSIDTLDLFYNKISGSIPKELGNLTRLKYLNLDNNNFNGTIPDQLGNLTNLKILRLSDNSLSGEVPEVLAKLPNLKLVELGNNPDLCGWNVDKQCP